MPTPPVFRLCILFLHVFLDYPTHSYLLYYVFLVFSLLRFQLTALDTLALALI